MGAKRDPSFSGSVPALAVPCIFSDKRWGRRHDTRPGSGDSKQTGETIPNDSCNGRLKSRYRTSTLLNSLHHIRTGHENREQA